MGRRKEKSYLLSCPSITPTSYNVPIGVDRVGVRSCLVWADLRVQPVAVRSVLAMGGTGPGRSCLYGTDVIGLHFACEQLEKRNKNTKAPCKTKHSKKCLLHRLTKYIP